MRRQGGFGSLSPPNADGRARPGSVRDRMAVALALVTVIGLAASFFLAKGTQFLMPGPLTSAHGSIEKCSACHTNSAGGKLSWLRGLLAGDPHADSKACLTCHKMSDTALNAHGASAEVLKLSTARLMKTASATPAPQSARAQDIAFPTHDVMARGLFCATCHQEHQGANFNLNRISSEQCRSCHVVKFDSFDGNHPKFDDYPFKRRTRIVYDHAGHFGKHFPEVAKKDSTKSIPATCATCHNSRVDKRIMAVAPFEQTCTACHLDQIIGKERATGPKGIAFLAVPGLDLQTLKKKNASIGEWPDASDAELTPFMKVMIGQNERGRALIKTVDGLNLQDLTTANDDQIKAVTSLVWAIKGLFYKLVAGKASDVLGDLSIGGGAKPSASLVADLTASIPRDVVITAQQQWLPNLGAEMASRPGTGNQEQSGWNARITETQSDGSASAKEPSGPDAGKAGSGTSSDATDSDAASPVASESEQGTSTSETPESSGSAAEAPAASDAQEAESKPGSQEDGSEATINAKRDPPACLMRVLGECLLFKEPAGQADSTDSKSSGSKEAPPAGMLPGAMQAGVKDAGPQAVPGGASGKADARNTKPDGAKEERTADAQPANTAADQSDDLLHPTEEELRDIKTRGRDAERAAPAEVSDVPSNADADAPADAPKVAVKAQTGAAPVISIESNIDPESWAEYGGWYRQDYGIFYRPAGHKDKFVYSWLVVTGPQAPKGDTSPAAAVFDLLTSKDAQGSCTKCHSVDDVKGQGRVVNFTAPSAERKQGRFTNFIHQPHFGIIENRGCLTCHSLEKGRPYLKSYEQGNPQIFASNFGPMKKELCQTCHTSGVARQDCLLCHKYHVNGVITPIINTKIPTQ